MDIQESTLDLFLNVLDIGLLRLQLIDEVVELLLENLILSGRVEVVEANTRDLIGIVLDLNLFLGDVLVGDLRLLEEIG